MLHEKGRPEAANPNNNVQGDGHQDRTTDQGHGHVGPSLLDYLDHVSAEGRRRAEEGMARAQYGEAIGIVSAIEADALRLAATNEVFIPCDILPDLASRKAVGPVVRRLQREGRIVCVGTATSKRPERHGALTRAYRGAGGDRP